MKTILETDSDFVRDIQAPCFQTFVPEEAEVVRASKTQVLSRKYLTNSSVAITDCQAFLVEKDGLIELHEKDIKVIKYDTLGEISRKG
jgi:hypothetical protein